MKYLVVIFLAVSLACAVELHLGNRIEPRNNEFPLINLDNIYSKINWEEIRSIVERENQALKAGSIVADVTNFTKAILANVGKLLNNSTLDPLGLGDQEINLFPGSLDITNGTLSDLHTITVSSSVIAKYTHDTRILELTLPISFDDLVIFYDYKVKVLLLSVHGTLTAKITNLKLNLRLGFNFVNDHAFVDKVDVKNTGSFDFNFTGLGLLDWIINLMSDALTTLFHGVILGVIDAVIYNPVNSVVQEINSVIDSILHPNSTSLLTY